MKEEIKIGMKKEAPILPEDVFYHNAFHENTCEGKVFDFFAPKSDRTKEINSKFRQILDTKKWFNGQNWLVKTLFSP